MSEKPQRPTRPSQNVPGSKPGPGGSKPGPGGPGGPTLGTGASKPGTRSDVERAMLLRDVMDHAVKVHKETMQPAARKTSQARTITLGLVSILLLAFSIYSWTARPEFIWGPTPAPPPVAEQEAGLRFAMFLLSQRIEGYRHSEGLYPSSLSEIGDSLQGVTYAVVGDAVFELRATVSGKPIVFRSDQRADDFLGNSTNIIQGLVPR